MYRDRGSKSETPTNSPIGVFYAWAVSCLTYGCRDPLTDLPLNLCDAGSLLKPTLLAHRIHETPLDFGQLTRFVSPR